MCVCSECALRALEDVINYLNEEDGQVAVSVTHTDVAMMIAQ